MDMADERPLLDLTDQIWDAVVVGAGPAGALAAHGLASAGARVLLVDRATFPRPKICGCCLNSRALDVLRRDGFLPHVMALAPHPYDRLHVAAGRSETTLRLPAGVAVARDRLDTALVRTACSAGARLISGTRATMSGPTDREGLPTVFLEKADSGPSTTITCRVVIAATGLAAGFAVRELGGERISSRSRVGAHTVLADQFVASWSDRAINMAIGPGGYVGAVRLEDGRWNLAAAIDVGAVKRGRGVAPVVASILASVNWPIAGAADEACWRGTPRLSRRPMRVAAERIFAVGDAAGYVEPFTGEGMACALEGGQAVVALALEAIERWSPALVEEWTDLLTRRIQRRMALPTIVAWSTRCPGLAANVTAVLSRWPDLATPAIQLANASTSARSGYRR